MKVLTLSQPWATLVAIGAKKIETRSWNTRYRGPLLIHAAAGLGPGGRRAFYDLCYSEAFREVLEPAMTGTREIAGFTIPHIDADMLPRGAIIARCELTAVHQIPSAPMHFPRGVPADHPLASYPVILPPLRDIPERSFGDYTPGRYAWLLSDVQALPTPIPVKGQLGLWEYDL